MKITELSGSERFIVDTMAVMYHLVSGIKAQVYIDGKLADAVLATDEMDEVYIAFPADTEVYLVK